MRSSVKVSQDYTQYEHETPCPSLDDVHRRIGRNIHKLQGIEKALKVILPLLSRTGDVNDPKAALLRANKRFERATLGNLCKEYCGTIAHDFEKPECQLNPGQFSIRFGFDYYDDVESKLRSSLDMLVHNRNRLIHHLDEDLDWRCNESRSEYSAWLDSEYQKIEELSEHLKNIGKAIPTIYENALRAIEDI
tara:strand:- start:98 stop:673 length:576 start_codon:yes stop_codon:yes gene_type:complete